MLRQKKRKRKLYTWKIGRIAEERDANRRKERKEKKKSTVRTQPGRKEGIKRE